VARRPQGGRHASAWTRRRAISASTGWTASATPATTSGCCPGRDFAGDAANSVIATLAHVGVELTDAELAGVAIARG